MFSGMQFRKLKEEWIYAILVSNKMWERANIFSLMVSANYLSVMKEADL